MSTRYQIRVDGFKVKMKNLDANEVTITDTFFTDFYKKWAARYKGGFDFDGEGNEAFDKFPSSPYQGIFTISDAIVELTGSRFGYNPFLLTIEDETIFMYGVDLKVPDPETVAFGTAPNEVTVQRINPTIQNNGANELIKASGGNINNLSGGKTWKVEGTGTVKDPDGVVIENPASFSFIVEDPGPPMPFLFFERLDT